jgi:hypothetical protein
VNHPGETQFRGKGKRRTQISWNGTSAPEDQTKDALWRYKVMRYQLNLVVSDSR